MTHRIQFAIVILIGAVLLAWLVVSLKYTIPLSVADGRSFGTTDGRARASS